MKTMTQRKTAELVRRCNDMANVLNEIWEIADDAATRIERCQCQVRGRTIRQVFEQIAEAASNGLGDVTITTD